MFKNIIVLDSQSFDLPEDVKKEIFDLGAEKGIYNRSIIDADWWINAKEYDLPECPELKNFLKEKRIDTTNLMIDYWW